MLCSCSLLVYGFLQSSDPTTDSLVPWQQGSEGYLLDIMIHRTHCEVVGSGGGVQPGVRGVWTNSALENVAH